MCFNYKVSLLTFTLGVIFSILLITSSNANATMKKQNIIVGIFFIFIALIQLMDFLFWIDLKNKLGINKITTILGPILNVCQPVILYIIKLIYYKPNILTLQNYNLPVALLNLLYVGYFISIYVKFLKEDSLITSAKNGHLNWGWISYSNPVFYLILLTINIFYLFSFKYALILFGIIYFFMIISYKYFNYNVGELWCFFGAFMPIIFYLIFRRTLL
jgi:hypothetical protein